MELKTVLTKNPNAAYRIYEGQATIVLPEHSEVNVLNPIGSVIWDGIDGRRTLEEILQQLLNEYDISREQATSDLEGFVASLREHGMVS